MNTTTDIGDRTADMADLGYRRCPTSDLRCPDTRMSLVNYRRARSPARSSTTDPDGPERRRICITSTARFPKTEKGRWCRWRRRPIARSSSTFCRSISAPSPASRPRFQLYTVPGQVYYQTTRKLVLQGADGVVFVADSQARQLEENIESFQDLHANLAEQGVDPRAMPLVIQYNKQDLPSDLILTTEELSDAMNFRGVPEFPGGRAARAGRLRDAARHLGARPQAAQRRRGAIAMQVDARHTGSTTSSSARRIDSPWRRRTPSPSHRGSRTIRSSSTAARGSARRT